MRVLNELYDTISEKMAYEEKKWTQFKSSLSSSLKQQFFELFEQGYSDEEIALELFRSEKAIPPYRNTKSDVKTALQFELLKFKPSNYRYSRIQRAYYQAIKQQTILKIMVGLGKNYCIKELAENLIKRSLYFDFTEITLDVSRQMLRYYSVKERNPQKAEYYSTIIDKYLAVQLEEIKVEQVQFRIEGKYRDKNTTKLELIKIANEYLGTNDSSIKEIPSYNYYLRYYLIKIYKYRFENKFEEAFNTALLAYNFFCEKVYNHKVAKQSFLLYIVDSLLNLGEVIQSIQYQNLILELTNEGHTNWFVALELKMLSLMSYGEYTEVVQLEQTMVGNRNYKYQTQDKQAKWVLLGLYADLITQIQKSNVQKLSITAIDKRLRYLNKNSEHLKKLEIPYIIIQLLFEIYKQDYQAIESKIFGLKTYCNTYLRKGTPNFRSNCFIKMLLQIPQNNFHPIAVQRKAMPYQRKLESEGFKIDHDRVMEVIPYEKMWEIILNFLKAPKRRRKSQYTLHDWSLGNRN